MENETFDFGKDLKITCRKPTSVEVYIHSMMNLLYDGPSKSFVKPYQATNSNFYLRRNGFNNDI